ncbi:single-stranded DNA-binding protein [Romboutsia sp. 1001713B170131_170501_G6]|uniref:single-stranded DNA-binding protein n=1 Tax=Romboutsia sp. 1001713B170131_170501_G6 TaxID=2787108 RepID=UPI0018AA26E6|nr:single-stranded DNA-binding protein [Romboutsia sp. 1001713B170131_170501_G6]
MNHVVLVGRLTRDPELRYIAGSGTPVANFSIAIDREFSGKDGKRETDFIDIQVWGKSAENCANYIGKGSLVAVQGSIRVDVYQNQAGENRRAFRVNANRVQFLDSRNKSENSYNKGNQPGFEPSFEPTFEPQGLDPQGFQAIDDDDIPF